MTGPIDLKRKSLQEVLDYLNNKIGRLEGQIGNPSVVALYPPTMEVNGITINHIEFGGLSRPTAPQNVVATPGNLYRQNWINLTWMAPDDGLVNSYTVLVARTIVTGVYENPVSYTTDATVTQLMVPGLDPATTYGIRIIPIAPDSTTGFPYPDEFTWFEVTTLADTTAPAAVTGLTLDPSLGAIVASWADNTEPDTGHGVGRYELQIDTVNTFNSGNFQSVLVAGTAFTLAGLVGGTTYYVRVRAIDNSGNLGAWSSIVSTAPVGASAASDGSAPPAVGTPTALGLLGAIFVKWPPVSNADPVTYAVHVSTSASFTPSSATLASTTQGTSAVVKDVNGAVLVAGTTYYVRVVAADADGSAAASGSSTGVVMATVGTADLAVGAITAASGIIASLDAGIISTGTLSAARIASSSITAEKLTIGSTGASLGLNESFEDAEANTSGAAKWSAAVAGGATVSRLVDTTRAQQGSAMLSLAVGTAGSATVKSDFIPAAPGQGYYFRAQYGASVASTSGLTIQAVWFQSDKTTQVATSSVVVNGAISAAAVNSLLTEWQATAPAGAAWVQLTFVVSAPASATTVYLDSFSVQPLSTALTIADNAVTANKILAGSIDTTKITALGINASVITAGTMSGQRIQANTLDATALTASTINADLTVASRIKTADTGARVELSAAGLYAYDQNNLQTIEISAVTGGASLTGGITAASIDNTTLGTSTVVNTDLLNTRYEIDTDGGYLALHSISNTSVVFSTTGAGSWTAPAGVTSVRVEAVGAGSAGVNGTSGLGSAGGAGGGIGLGTVAVTPGTAYNLFVAPAQGTAANTVESYFIGNAGAKVSASSGSKSTGGIGKYAGLVTNPLAFKGGNGGAAALGPAGGGGSAAGPNGNGNVGLSPSDSINGGAGGTASGTSGAGGKGGDNVAGTKNGIAGAAPGGGGGGGGPTGTGGAGARGQVRLTYSTGAPTLLGSISQFDTTDKKFGTSIPAGVSFYGNPITDWNTANKPGFYAGWTTAANGPVANRAYTGYVYAHPDQSGYFTQVVNRLSASNAPEIWIRTWNVTNGWGTWKNVFGDDTGWVVSASGAGTDIGFTPAFQVTITGARYRRVGNRVTWYVTGTLGTAAANNFGASTTATGDFPNTTLFTVPAGLEPTQTSPCRSGGTGAMFAFAASTAGAVQIVAGLLTSASSQSTAGNGAIYTATTSWSVGGEYYLD